MREPAVAAALKWKFEPIEVSGKPTKAVSTVAINLQSK